MLFWIVPLAFLAAGVFGVARGGYAVVSWVLFNRRARPCDASVTGVRREWKAGSGDSSGHYVYFPVLSFRTDDGQEVRTVAGNYSGRDEYQVGDGVDACYDPRDPGRAYTGSGTSVAMRAVLELVIGAIVLIIAIPMLVR